MFKKLFGNKKEEGGESKQASRYYDLKVDRINRETKDAISIYFENPDSGRPDYKPGQFLTLVVPVGGKELRRSYSLCSTPYADKQMAVTVKRIKDGIVSNHLNDNLKEGDTIKVMEPMGVFTTSFDVNSYRHIVLIGGGSGITPLMSILRSVLLKEPNSFVSLIYANRDEESIIFRDYLEELQNDYGDRLNLVHILDNHSDGWEGHSGLMTPEKLKTILSELPESDEAFTEYFLCGPTGMMEIVMDTLNNLDIEKQRIHRESFVSKSANPLNNVTEEQQSELGRVSRDVTIVLDGEEHQFSVEPEQTILEAGLDLDIDMPFSCQSGLCTACRGKLVSGKVEMDESEGLSEQEIEEGYVLCCVGHPMTEDVKIEIG
jgi:ring-1,2-phenylacetyl-CoA epoxidase subunit PaaE